jgi:hypothetical protein
MLARLYLPELLPESVTRIIRSRGGLLDNLEHLLVELVVRLSLLLELLQCQLFVALFQIFTDLRDR